MAITTSISGITTCAFQSFITTILGNYNLLPWYEGIGESGNREIHLLMAIKVPASSCTVLGPVE